LAGGTDSRLFGAWNFTKVEKSTKQTTSMMSIMSAAPEGIAARKSSVFEKRKRFLTKSQPPTGRCCPVDLGCADREVRVKQIGETDAVGLGRKPQKFTVGVECVASCIFQELEAALLTPIDEALTNPAIHAED
jgi:hypothetical protein